MTEDLLTQFPMWENSDVSFFEHLTQNIWLFYTSFSMHEDLHCMLLVQQNLKLLFEITEEDNQIKSYLQVLKIEFPIFHILKNTWCWCIFDLTCFEASVFLMRFLRKNLIAVRLYYVSSMTVQITTDYQRWNIWWHYNINFKIRKLWNGRKN